MKNVLILLFVLVTFSFGKECYFSKVDKVCYYKYFDRAKIYKAKADENYYVNKKGSIYSFDNVIEVKFNSIGGIFTILNDYELEFVDKINKSTYLFKVEDRRDLFPTLSKLNKLDTIMKAQPHRTRKFTNAYIERKKEARKARMEAVIKQAKERAEKSKNGKLGNENVLKAAGIKGSFLNPDGD